METLAEFRNKVSHPEGSTRNYKVKGSVGVYDMYKYIRKNHWFNIGRPVTEKEFYAIIRGINRLLAENIVNGKTVKFPYKMGSLELRKFQVGVSFKDGKLHNTYPINWGKTLQLWYEDPEAHRKKILLRDENPWMFSVRYNKYHAIYNNKQFYQFDVNTFIKKGLSKNIKQGKIDTIW